MAEAITIDDIRRARETIADAIRETRLAPSPYLSAMAGAPVHLKLENHQVTGSFKLRGATNAIARLTDGERSRGVVGVSTGNHGRGLAWAAQRAGLRCVICMSRLVPRNKVEAIGELGAEIRIMGNSQDEAQIEADRLAAEDGLVPLPPFDHADIIAGQGTLGLEIIEALPELETLLVPVSGGGLVGGIAIAVKAINPDVRIIGISMERGAAMHASLAAGRPVDVEELPTLADSLGGGIGLGNRYTFRIVRDLVDDVLLVEEDQIAGAIRHVHAEEGQTIEGGGAVGIAALRAGLVDDPGVTAVVLSGGNIDKAVHARIVAGEKTEFEG